MAVGQRDTTRASDRIIIFIWQAYHLLIDKSTATRLEFLPFLEYAFLDGTYPEEFERRSSCMRRTLSNLFFIIGLAYHNLILESKVGSFVT